MEENLQERIDKFYFKHGPCCAGCDWWRYINSRVGECTQSAPVPSSERAAMLEIENSTLTGNSGHILTRREHVCGQFKDDFDWSSLSLPYQKRLSQHVED